LLAYNEKEERKKMSTTGKIKITFEVDSVRTAQHILEKVSAPNVSATTQPAVAEPATESAPKASAPSKPATGAGRSEDSQDTPTQSEETKVLISDAVQKYADEHGIDVTQIEGSGKQGRVIKSDVAKAIQEKADEEEEEEFGDDDDDFDLLDDDDDDEEPEAPTFTLDDVREALKSFQIAAKNKLLKKGKDEAEAKSKAINAARKLLSDTAGTDKLGAVKEEQFGDVVDAAVVATAKVS
jgi:pyruvate/2-oxoglutarate dehydrogenase complex dihydrolipoamide acyltransferase (E2) component